MATKVKALQMWCKKMAEGYRDVEVRDMTSSWKDGLAFCAIIHRFRPDLIDFDGLSKENIFDNNKLAFDIAESELGIPALLDAPDMVAIRVPDKLSIVTYVSQYYNFFHNKPQLGGPGVKKPSTLKRTQPSLSSGPDAKRQSLTPSDGTPNKDRQVSMGDKCAICHKKVYLLERHVSEGRLYHRTCFRSSDSSPQSKIYQRLDAMTDKDDDKHSVQKRKSEEPDFWKRRAEAKKAGNKANAHVSNGSASHLSKQEGNDLHSNIHHHDHNHNTHHEANHGGKGKDHHQGRDSKDMEKDSRNSGPVGAKLDAVKHSDTKDNKNSTTHVTSSILDKKPHASSPQPRVRHVAKIGAFKDNREVEPMDTSSSGDSKATTKSKGVGNILDRLKPAPKTEVKKEEEKKGVTVVPRARRVVKIGAKQDDDLSEAKRTKSPPPAKLTTKVLTPDSEPPPLPSSQPPTVKVSTPTSPPSLRSNLPPQLPSESTNSSGILPSPRTRSPPSRPVSSPVHITTPHARQSQPEHPLSKESPKVRPRNLKTADINVSNRTSDIGPLKPPRVSANLDETSRKSEDANVMSPTKQDQELLGGLLKNLQDIRHRKLSEESSDNSPLSPTGGLDTKLQNIPESKDARREVKSLDFEKEKKKDRTDKAKSSFLSGKLSVFSSKEGGSDVSHSSKDPPSKEVAKNTVAKKEKEKPSLIANEDNDVPEWKKALEERKKKKDRPKSVDLLSDQTSEPSWKSGLNKTGKARPKTMDVSSELEKEKDQRPAWQIEAEKRAAARQSGFVDPEKAKIDQGLKKSEEKINNDSEKIAGKQRLLPSTPVTNNRDSDSEKKKVAPDVKFRFSLDFDKKDKDKDAGKPPRPPSLAPSGPRWTNGLTEEGKMMSRHEPPARPVAPRTTEVKTFGDVKRLTPQEIQKQLADIDTRLTDLEIRGRTLEDSIRKAQEEEEDETQMVEWFKLVNEKNELVRKEADLIYISRAQDLEDEQHELDQKIRKLDRKPEYLKTDADKEEQEFLLNKLVEVVNQRSLIVDSQDEDRIRYEEEDRTIQEILETKGFCKEPKAGKKKEGKHEKKKKKKEKEK